MQTYESEYKKLNPTQKEAVDTIEGPVMVVAGPGTGKTQTVGLRVANILRKTQMRPGNILCLTFSKSGATAMRERLRALIGPDAYRVEVNTIHGFCNDIITGHPHVFDDWSALEQISDVERYREVNKILDQLLPDCRLVNRKSPYSRTGQILGRISQLKREGVTDREELLKIADQYDQIMSTKSKEGTKAHEKNLLMSRKFRDFLEVFFRYQEMLERTGRYDYEDMILYVIQALKEEDWMLDSLKERYQYILVDEFQDTNGAQYQLMELLSSDPADNNPNLFVVGDDDQAIYRFQGANLQNILSFRRRFPQAPVITLTTSYRCSQPILDAAYNLIENNTERLVGKIEGLKKELVSPRAESRGDTLPHLLLSPSDTTEPFMIADVIEERLEQGIAPSEIAILVQTNRELAPIYDVLRARDIPVQMSGKADLLTHPLVMQVVTILKAIHDKDMKKSDLLAAAMSCECFGCHPAALARIFAKRIQEERTLYEVFLEVDDDEAIVHARDILIDLHNKLDSRTVLQTVEHVIKECGLLSTSAAGVQEPQRSDPLDIAALTEFFNRVQDRAYEQSDFKFESFLSDVEFYENSEYKELRLSYSLPHLTEEGVQLMTAHKSKGLEFHTVILANFRDRHWDKRRNPPSVSIPEDLLFGWEKDQKTFEQNQDERRVAYVAMTRAERELVFTCPKELTTGDSLKAISPSGFFAEAGDLPEKDRNLKNPEQASTLLLSPMRKIDEELEAFLRERIENFALSPTALNDFLENPQMFVERHLLQFPQARDPAYAYGNAVHHVLARWAIGMQEGKMITKEDMIAQFKDHLSQREVLTDAEKARLVNVGEEALPRYFDQRLQEPYPIVHNVEHGMKATINDVPIKGKIDRIDLLEPNSSACIVTDFKTGAPKSPAAIEKYGYHRQLVFYALLIENGYSILDPKQFVLDFVGEGGDHPVQRVYEVSQQDKKELTELIQKVWAKIVALDFSPF